MSPRPDAEELELSFGLLPGSAQGHVARLIEERDRALAEVYRLRQRDDEMRPIVADLRLEVDVRKRGEEELAKQRDELRTEVARLRTAREVDREVRRGLNEVVLRQRDELADALETALPVVAMHGTQTAYDAIRDALQSAGRLKED